MAYDNLGELRQQLIQDNPVFAAVDQIQPAGGQRPTPQVVVTDASGTVVHTGKFEYG